MMVAWRAAGFLACVLTFPVAAGQAPDEDPTLTPTAQPLQLNTDRPEYCKRLEAEVREVEQRQQGPHPEVDMLIREGAAQCSAGHIKNGVHRLRTALVKLGGG